MKNSRQLSPLKFKPQSIIDEFKREQRRKHKKLFFEPLPMALTINLDLLQVAFKQLKGKHTQVDSDSFFVSEFFIPSDEQREYGEFTVRKSYSRRPRTFRQVHEILHKGLKVAEVESEPYSNYIKRPDECILRLQNQILYGDWYTMLHKMATTFHLKFQSISHVDIALDGRNFLYPIRKMKREQIDLVGCPDWKLINTGHKVKGFNLGSRKNHKYCRAYNKSKEIEQHSKKYYIKEFWKKSGVAQSDIENMERLEVCLKSCEVKKYFPEQSWETLKKLANPEYMRGVAENGLKNLYEFRERTYQKNVSRARRLFQVVYKVARAPIEIMARKSAKRIRALQTTIKQTYLLYLKTGRADLSNYIDELCLNLGLSDWFTKRKTAFDYEYNLVNRHDDDFIHLFDPKTKQYVRPELSLINPVHRRSVIL